MPLTSLSANAMDPPSTVGKGPKKKSDQNGSPVGTTPSTAPEMNSQYGTQFNANAPYLQSTPRISPQFANDQMKAYWDARQACAGQPVTQQAACNNDADNRFSAVDPKCHKLSGSALAECLQGVDHGD